METLDVNHAFANMLSGRLSDNEKLTKLCAKLDEKIRFMSDQIKRLEEDQRVFQAKYPEMSNKVEHVKNETEEVKKEMEVMLKEAYQTIRDMDDVIASLKIMKVESES